MKVADPLVAFILYRQHNQAAVVAKNPGLANPEISKVIGDLWRGATQETRNHWKLLAEVCPRRILVLRLFLNEM